MSGFHLRLVTCEPRGRDFLKKITCVAGKFREVIQKQEIYEYRYVGLYWNILDLPPPPTKNVIILVMTVTGWESRSIIYDMFQPSATQRNVMC